MQMYNYANLVRSLLNQNNREIMMQFIQVVPKYKENSLAIDGTDVDVVASVVMHPEDAQNFAKSILDLLGDETKE